MYNFYETDSEESRKDREKLFKKNEILNAAVVVFSVKGFSKATLEEIAEKSQFGKATLYNYFTSKEEIYNEIVHSIYNNYHKIVENIDQNSATFVEFITNLINQLFELLTTYPDYFMLITRIRFDVLLNKENSEIPFFEEEIHIIDKFLTKWVSFGIENNEINNIDIPKFNHLFKSMIFPYIGGKIHQCASLRGLETHIESEFLISVLLNGIIRK